MLQFPNNQQTGFRSSHKVCIVCYKITSRSTGNKLTLEKFLTFTGRFLGSGGSQKLLVHDNLLSCCKDCEVVISSFCDIYHNLKCLELQLEGKLELLVNVMKLANKVPSRMKELRKLFVSETTEIEEGESMTENACNNEISSCQSTLLWKKRLRNFKICRTNVIKKCILRLGKSQPRIVLQRLREDDDLPIGVSTPAFVDEPINLNLSQCLSNDISKMSGALGNAVKLLLSFTAVLMLAVDFVSLNTLGTNNQNSLLTDHYHEILGYEENILDSGTEYLEHIPPNENQEDCKFQPNFNESDEALDHHSKSNEEFCSNNHSPSSTAQVPLEPFDEIKPHVVIVNPSGSANIQNSREQQNNPSFKCRPCGKHFQQKLSLNIHILKNHPDLKAKLKQFKCFTCKMSFATYFALRNHSLSSASHQSRKKNMIRKIQSVNRKRGINSKSSAITERLAVPMNKTPKHREIVLTENEQPDVNNDVEPVASSSQRYNLRKNRKHSFKLYTNDHDGSDDSISESTSISDADSVSSSSSESDDATTSPPTKKRRDEDKSSDDIKPKFASCHMPECKHFQFHSKGEYNKHQKLHVPGHYKCNFCEYSDKSLIQLSNHESTNHSKDCSTNASTSNKIIYCPRCQFETENFLLYTWHFAKSHIPGFENIQSKKLNHLETCEICKLKTINKEIHFKRAHDMKDVDPLKTLKCSVEGCTAYFVPTFWQRTKYMKKHLLNVHRINSKEQKPESEDRPTNIKDLNLTKVTNKIEKQKFDCNICNKEFASLVKLNLHKTAFHSYRCPKSHCKAKFKTTNQLENHQKLHGNFNCQFCEVVKEYAPDLALHEAEVHAIRAEDRLKRRFIGKFFSCARCSTNFSIKTFYTKHFLDIHLDLSGTGIICHICNAESANVRVKRSKFLSWHMRKCHKIDGLDPSKIFRCDLCPAYFVKGRQLITHKIVTHYKKKCPECEKSFTEVEPNVLKRHMERRHPQFAAFPMFSSFCNIGKCRRQFPTEVELEHHKKHTRHLEMNGGLRCPTCEKEFRNGESLRNHIMSVHAPRSFICSECGKGFRANNQLKQHMKYHQGPDAWKFQCSTCGRKFADNFKLEQHFRTHSKEKPYICQYCGEKYAHRHNWRNHVKNKHGDQWKEEELQARVAKTDKSEFFSRKGSKKGDCILAGVQKN